MTTITFYSYKGGAGRSLALANAARYLARLDFRVVALDLDLESPGLQYKFSTSPKGEPLPVQLGVVDYLHEFLVQGELPSSLKDFRVDVAVPGADQPLIRLVPAGRVPSPDYWSKLSKVNWHEFLYSKDAKGVQLFLDFKNRIADELNPDFLLIDSRTGMTEIGGVATALLPDKLICLVLPSLENLEGARAVLRSLKRSRRQFCLEPLDVMVALSRLPEMKDRESERELADMILTCLNEEAEDLQDTLNCAEVFVLHSESALQVHETLRVGGGVSPGDSFLLQDYLRLFAGLLPQAIAGSRLERRLQAPGKAGLEPDGSLLPL